MDVLQNLINKFNLNEIQEINGIKMRKNDLIKMLESIKGNPEIMLWSSLVGDVVPISSNMEEVELYKDSLEYKQKVYENEYILSLKNGELTDLPDETEFYEKLKSLRQEAEAAYKKEKYEYRLYMNEKLIKSGTLKKKKVVVMQPRIVGKSSWDRFGEIKY